MQYTAIYQAIAHSLAVEPVAGQQGGLMGFSPKSLFASGAQGAWYDPSDYTTLFEDSAGTTPITSPLEKPVGLMLDKSKGLVLGPELVLDSTFSTGTGWAPFNSATLTTSGGIGTITNSSYSGIGTGSIATVGKWYKVTIVRTGGTATSYRANILGTTVTLNPTTTSVIVQASATTVTAFINSPTAGETILLDSYSVRELTGNHAYQSTTTSRPTLSARKNKLVGTATLATQNATTTAVGHVLSFWGTGTVTLSGTATGSLVGTGVNDRVSLTFTPTAGTLTLTVTGSVLKAQLEEINETV